MYIYTYLLGTHGKPHPCPIPTNCGARRCLLGRMSPGNAAGARSSAPGSVASKRTAGAAAEALRVAGDGLAKSAAMG